MGVRGTYHLMTTILAINVNGFYALVGRAGVDLITHNTNFKQLRNCGVVLIV